MDEKLLSPSQLLCEFFIETNQHRQKNIRLRKRKRRRRKDNSKNIEKKLFFFLYLICLKTKSHFRRFSFKKKKKKFCRNLNSKEDIFKSYFGCTNERETQTDFRLVLNFCFLCFRHSKWFPLIREYFFFNEWVVY